MPSSPMTEVTGVKEGKPNLAFARENPLLQFYFTQQTEACVDQLFLEALYRTLRTYNAQLFKKERDPRPASLKPEVDLSKKLKQSGFNRLLAYFEINSSGESASSQYWETFLEKLTQQIDKLPSTVTNQLEKQFAQAIKLASVANEGIAVCRTYMEDLVEVLVAFKERYSLEGVPLIQKGVHYKELVEDLRNLDRYYARVSKRGAPDVMVISFLRTLPADYSIGMQTRKFVIDCLDTKSEVEVRDISNLAKVAGKAGVPMYVFLARDPLDEALPYMQAVANTSANRATKEARLTQALKLEIKEEEQVYRHLVDIDATHILNNYLDSDNPAYQAKIASIYYARPSVFSKLKDYCSKEEQTLLLNGLANYEGTGSHTLLSAIDQIDASVDLSNFISWFNKVLNRQINLPEIIPSTEILNKIIAPKAEALVPKGRDEVENAPQSNSKTEILNWLRSKSISSRFTRRVAELDDKSQSIFMGYIDNPNVTWQAKLAQYLHRNFDRFIDIISDRNKERLEGLKADIWKVRIAD